MQEEEALSPIRTEVPSNGFRSAVQSVPQDDVFPAKTESNVLGDRNTAKSNAGRIRYSVRIINLLVSLYYFIFISRREERSRSPLCLVPCSFTLGDTFCAFMVCRH